MNYSVVSLVIILMITLSQYVILRNQFAAFRAKVTVQESDTNELVKQLRAQVEPLKSQFETCKSERDKEAGISKQQFNDLNAKVKKLETDLGEKQNERDGLEEEKNQVLAEKEAIVAEKETLDEKVKTLEADIAKLNEDVIAEQAKVIEAQKQVDEAKAQAEAAKPKPEEAEKKAPPSKIDSPILDKVANALPPINDQIHSSIQPKLRFEDDIKSIPDDQRKEQQDKQVPKPQNQLKYLGKKPELLKDEHVDLTKEQLDKEAVKEQPGKIVLDQKERERAQLPNVNPKAIQVKSIDKVVQKGIPKGFLEPQQEKDDIEAVDSMEYNEITLQPKTAQIQPGN